MKNNLNYDNLVFKFLEKYFRKEINDNEYIGKKLDSLFGFANNFYNSGKITDAELDLLLSNNNELIDLVILIISNCPYISINLHN